MTYLVNNVLHLAAEKGMDQAQVGKAAGVSQSTVSRIYSNEIGDTGYRNVQKLAAFFGVTMDDLVNRDIASKGVARASQTERLDAETLSSAMGFLAHVSRLQAAPIDFSQDAEALIAAYGLVSREPSSFDREEAVQRMVEWLRARRQADAQMDRRDAGGPSARGVRKGK